MKPILILDDSPEDIVLIRLALQEAKLSNPVHAVTSVPYAMAYLQGTFPYSDREKFPVPSIVMVDLRMPLMDGFDFLKWKKHAPAMEKVLAVVVSGDDNPDHIRQARELGASGFINKFNLKADLERFLSNHPGQFGEAE